ncbi:MAG: diguanylate cyclase [Lachnospiraceae bacterium]|nr:diguanylate cyclase [Lachnospiraceae bacterium]
MRQFQYKVENLNTFTKDISKLSQWCEGIVSSNIVFQIFTETIDEEEINNIVDIITNKFPYAKYMGCSTNGNICQGNFAGSKTCVICTIYEYQSTKIDILECSLTQENIKDVTDSIIDAVNERPWVKAIELLLTIRGVSMSDFCDNLSELRDGVAVFGGGAFAPDINSLDACVFSSSGTYSNHGIVYALIGGDDFFVDTMHITGWKPLGRNLLVTKAKNSILYELDHKPSYDVYYKYLNIGNDENFFTNTLEFPFFYEHNGLNILRAPTSSNPDGSLNMTADMDENVYARMAYGDPWTILDNVKKKAQRINTFNPEVIRVFSCAARRTFWGDKEVGKETLPFQAIASTSGFYTSGEFLRTDKSVNQHNVTLVVAALKEGESYNYNEFDFEVEDDIFSGKVSMINRLATFIEAATEELEEANKKLELAAISDGLTKLLNRKEIQHRITHSIKKLNDDYDGNVSLIMMDIDDFKKVNDTYGHKEGDIVLIELSNMLRDVAEHEATCGMAGRWGGEEFMLLLNDCNKDEATRIAEVIRQRFKDMNFEKSGSHTISLGVTEAIAGEDPDTTCIRVDSALYDAKHAGKDKVIVV